MPKINFMRFPKEMIQRNQRRNKARKFWKQQLLQKELLHDEEDETKDAARDKVEDAAQDDEGPKDGKVGEAPKGEKIGKAGDDAPDHAEGQAIGKAEEGEETCSAKNPIRRVRLDSRRKTMTIQKNLMRMYNEMIPTMSDDQRM